MQLLTPCHHAFFPRKKDKHAVNLASIVVLCSPSCAQLGAGLQSLFHLTGRFPSFAGCDEVLLNLLFRQDDNRLD